MKIPLFSLEACDFDDLNLHNKVFNSATVEYYLWIHLPLNMIRDCELFQISEIAPRNKELSWNGLVERECDKPWLKVTTSLLDTSVGSHLYKFSFVHRYTNDVVSVYISYTIQNDNPDKPYVYMNKTACSPCKGVK